MNSQRVLVAGSKKSGIAATRLLLELGGDVVLYDSDKSLDKEKLLRSFGKGAGVTVVLGKLSRTDLIGVELAVFSPGIPLNAPFVTVLEQVGIPIWSEVQLAYQVSKGKLIAITGTNGKTTTTALTGEIMKSFFEEVFVVGNIGIPYTQTALLTTDETVTVAEISSFQLEAIMDFRPNISVILNISPDHLDRHGTMEYYTEIKKSITMNQKKEDSVILNYDDPVLREFGESKNLMPKVVFFSSRQQLWEGCYLDGSKMVYRKDGKTLELLDVSELQILGRHNYENAMAAAAIAVEMGIPPEKIRHVMMNFKAVEHRIEFVMERFGVKYYNDSKGTNPDAAIQAVKAMPGPTLLIAGGYDKNADYDEWIESFGDKVQHLVLIGQTRDKIADCAMAHGFTEIMYAEDLPEAVRVCASYANAGDYVLLSPACASWGMFDSYEQRGNVFKECVHNL